jgi:hypothetical protein
LIFVCAYARLPPVAAVAVILFVVTNVIATAVTAVTAASWNALPAVGDGGQ